MVTIDYTGLRLTGALCINRLTALELHVCVNEHALALLSAIPIPDPDVKMDRILLEGELTSPINPTPGCRFAKRCIYAKPECSQKNVDLVEVEPGHFVACIMAKDFHAKASEA